jgi:hypothetical protein
VPFVVAGVVCGVWCKVAGVLQWPSKKKKLNKNKNVGKAPAKVFVWFGFHFWYCQRDLPICGQF